MALESYTSIVKAYLLYSWPHTYMHIIVATCTPPVQKLSGSKG